jgi:hypothetical protein
VFSDWLRPVSKTRLSVQPLGGGVPMDAGKREWFMARSPWGGTETEATLRKAKRPPRRAFGEVIGARA